MTSQPIDLDRQPNAAPITRAELQRAKDQARAIAKRIKASAEPALADVDRLVDLVLSITGGGR